MPRGIRAGPVLLAAAGSALFFPVFAGILNGQDTAFLFLGAALWIYGLLTNRDPLAGLGLSLTTVRPHVALALALPFLFRRRKVFGWFVLGSAALGLLSVLILGPDGTRAFVDLLLVSAGGEWYGMKEPEMFNLIGLLFRLAPWLGAEAIRAIGWGFYLLAIAGLCLLWLRSDRLSEAHLGLAVIVTLFAVPHLHFHDLALLLLPIHGLLRASPAEGPLKTQDAVLLPLAISVFLVIGNFTPVLKYSFPYLVMLVLGVTAWFPHRIAALFRRSG